MTAKKHLKMTNPGEVRRAMTRVSNMVLNGDSRHRRHSDGLTSPP